MLNKPGWALGPHLPTWPGVGVRTGALIYHMAARAGQAGDFALGGTGSRSAPLKLQRGWSSPHTPTEAREASAREGR